MSDLTEVLKKLEASGIKGAIEAAVASTAVPKVSLQAAPGVSKAIVTEVAKDPVVINSINAESPIQSRVAWGSTLAALGVIVPLIVQLAHTMGWASFNITTDQVVSIGGAIVTLAGAAYALYGRFATGLKPLFHKDTI